MRPAKYDAKFYIKENVIWLDWWRSLVFHIGKWTSPRFTPVAFGKMKRAKIVKFIVSNVELRKTVSAINHLALVRPNAKFFWPKQYLICYTWSSTAAVFGDPHFYTFDNMTYTFNGKGEFVLVRADTVRHKLDVQARFEAIPNNVYGTARATVLTAVAGST